MRAGDLNRSITLKQPLDSRDDEGSKVVTYPPLLTVTCRANIRSNSNARALDRGATVLLNTETVTIRNANNRLGLNEDWLLFYDSKDHVIQTIDRGAYITIIVKSDG